MQGTVSFVANASTPCRVTYGLDPALANADSVLSQVTGEDAATGESFHSAALAGLSADTRYHYSIQDDADGASAGPFSFVHEPARTPNTVAFFADFGLTNARSLPRLTQLAAAGAHDLVLHGGDIGYDMWESAGPGARGTVGAAFMRSVQPLAAAAPYVACPGNHEAGDDFAEYLQRFAAQAALGSGTPFYFSFDSGLAHYVALDTEVWEFGPQTGASGYPFQPQQQLDWLEADLAAAERNRGSVPWVIIFGHKGWYMDWFPSPRTLQGNFSAFSPLLLRYRVDLFLSGHQHIYQRFLPLDSSHAPGPGAPPEGIDRGCASGRGGRRSAGVYTRPKYTTHIVVGSPGNREATTAGGCAEAELGWPQIRPALAVCKAAYGFGTIRIYNRTHLHWAWEMTSAPTPAAEGGAAGGGALPLVGVKRRSVAAAGSGHKSDPLASSATNRHGAAAGGDSQPMPEQPAWGESDELWLIRAEDA